MQQEERLTYALIITRTWVNEVQFYKHITQQKMTFACRVLRGSCGTNVLVEGEVFSRKINCRPMSMRLDEIKQWTNLDQCEEMVLRVQRRCR